MKLLKFELINPSDAVFFKAPSLSIAAFAVIFLSPKYGAKQVDGDLEVPIFMFGGAEEWFKEELKIDDIGTTFETIKEEVATCLESFCIEKGGRTSMNDICKYAKEDAARIRKAIAKETA